MLKTKYWAENQEIEIHELELNFCDFNDEDIIIKNENRDFDSLTRVLINDVINIYLYWDSSDENSNTIETIISPEANVLFIGAGAISIQYDILNSKLIRARTVSEFQYFIKHKNNIIESCYGECTAFSLSGEIINHHTLDMMWEIEHIDGYFCTVCDFNGTRKLVKADT